MPGTARSPGLLFSLTRSELHQPRHQLARSPGLLFSLTRSELRQPDISFKKNRACFHFVSEAAGGQTKTDGRGQGRGEGVERRLELKNLNSSGLILALPLTCCVTLGKPMPLSELQMAYLQN